MITKDSLLQALNPNWSKLLGAQNMKCWTKIVEKLNSGEFYPNINDIFNAFTLEPENIKVVLLAEEPYSKGESCGLAYSVKCKQRLTYHVSNILKEIGRSYMTSIPKQHNGDLTKWINEGVFLLNIHLTVEQNNPKSHQDINWELFTSIVIEYLAKTYKNIIYIGLGRTVQTFLKEIQKFNKEMIILESGHPCAANISEPLFGSNIFIEANKLLLKNDILPVRWLSVLK